MSCHQIMKFFSIAATLALLSSGVSAFPTLISKRDGSESTPTNKTILLTNDDGWASTNIRATYRELKSAGYDVLLVAPASQKSGFGGLFDLPTSVNLTEEGEFGYPAKGSPSWGHEEDDINVWYFDGTPASCVSFGMDYLIPKHFHNKSVDLVIAGPNEGTNISPGMFTLSGTIGATYSAVGRGLPAIAFSGRLENNSFYQDDIEKEDDDSFYANVYARKVVEIVNTLFTSQNNYPYLLPYTTGLNVNLPLINEDCMDPEWALTRLSGQQSVSAGISYNETLGLFDWRDVHYDPTTKCIFGDCDLPSESTIYYKELCQISVSVFSIDYDASYQQYRTAEKVLTSLFD